MVRLAVPATTANLGPGYDCLGLALALHNCLEIMPAAKWQLSIRGEGADSLPRDESNLVWQSMCRLWRETETPIPRVGINMENRIPLGRGLGSSAAAIVAGLYAANHWAGTPLAQADLLQLAVDLEGHPDNVAPALLGGFCISVMGAEGVVTQNFAPHPSLRLVACVPLCRLATEKARRALPASVPHTDAVFNLSRTALMAAAITQGRLDLLGLASQDRLHQDYRKDLIPGFDEVVAAALAAGALACVLSGAGPTMLALLGPDGGREVGEAMVSAFASSGIRADYAMLRPDIQGVREI